MTCWLGKEACLWANKTDDKSYTQLQRIRRRETCCKRTPPDNNKGKSLVTVSRHAAWAWSRVEPVGGHWPYRAPSRGRGQAQRWALRSSVLTSLPATDVSTGHSGWPHKSQRLLLPALLMMLLLCLGITFVALQPLAQALQHSTEGVQRCLPTQGLTEEHDCVSISSFSV